MTTPVGKWRTARVAAVVTWLYVAAFGLPALPVAVYVRDRGRLPTFMDLFPMYGGPWSETVRQETLTMLLMAFAVLAIVVAWSGFLLWRRPRTGAIINLALLPVEAVFWFGFALPLPWASGIIRVVLGTRAWRSSS